MIFLLLPSGSFPVLFQLHEKISRLVSLMLSNTVLLLGRVYYQPSLEVAGLLLFSP